MILFDDVPMMIETPELQEFLNKYLPLPEMLVTADPHGDGPKINYTPPPNWRFSTFYFPTGAQRFGLFVGLCDTKTKNKIVDAGPTGKLRLALPSTCPSCISIETEMHLLRPKQLSCYKGPQLWAVPMVDERYWWQTASTGDIQISTSTTWADVYSALGTALGVTIEADTVDAAYLIPDFHEATRSYRNAAAMLDAVAHSVGQRIVRALDGTISAINWETSQERLVTNFKGDWTRSAGEQTNDERGDVPATVTVSFPKWKEYRPIEGEAHSYEVEPPADVFSATELATGKTKLIRSTCYADFTAGGSTPANDTELDALASKIAADYYQSLTRSHWYNFNGIKRWNPTGYDDWIIYSPGALRTIGEGGELDASTRIRSVPPNLEVEYQIQQQSTKEVIEAIQIGKLDEAPSSGVATASVWSGAGAGESDSGKNVEAFDWFGLGGATSDKIHLRHNGTAWYYAIDPGSEAFASAMPFIAPNYAGVDTPGTLPSSGSVVPWLSDMPDALSSSDAANDKCTTSGAGDYEITAGLECLGGSSGGGDFSIVPKIDGNLQIESSGVHCVENQPNFAGFCRTYTIGDAKDVELQINYSGNIAALNTGFLKIQRIG